jgi:hypothetical protein
MTNCLTDEVVQAVADDEADEKARAHVAECPHCRARVDETRRTLATLGALADRLPAPPIDLARRVEQTMRERNVGRERGATTLRTAPSSRAWRVGAWTSGLAAAALIVLAVFVIWPGMSRESHLSAAEILGRSMQTFAATSGIETFEYDAQFEGLAARALGPDARIGDTLRITQVIDHDHPGRFRVMSVDAGQVVRSVLVQDPEQHTRVGRFRVDDHTYFFRFAASPDQAGQPGTFVSLPDLQRASLRALVTMMQTTSDQTLTSVSDGGETYYAIRIPPISSDRDAGNSAGEASMLELHEAHALIHAGDFHLKELSARGSVLGQPFGLTFTLVRHEATPATQLAADTFTLEPQPGDVRLEGEATNDPAGDVVLAALRALAKARP